MYLTMKTIIYSIKFLMHYGLIISLAFLSQSDFRFRQARNSSNVTLDTASQKSDGQLPESLDTHDVSSSAGTDQNLTDTKIGGELNSADVSKISETPSVGSEMADSQQSLAQESTAGQDTSEDKDDQQSLKSESESSATPLSGSLVESESPSDSNSSNSVAASQSTTDPTDSVSNESEKNASTELILEKTDSAVAGVTGGTSIDAKFASDGNTSTELNQGQKNLQTASDDQFENLTIANSQPKPEVNDDKSQSETNQNPEEVIQTHLKPEETNSKTDTNPSTHLSESTGSVNSGDMNQPDSVSGSISIAETETGTSASTDFADTENKNIGNSILDKYASNSGEHQADDSTFATSYESNQKDRLLGSPSVAETGTSDIALKVETDDENDTPGSLGASLVENASPLPISGIQSHAISPSESDQKLSQPVGTTHLTPDLQKVIKNGSALALEDETWRSMSVRIYGNADWAEKLWRLNRDRHSGDVEAKIIPGRLVRLIDNENMPDLSRMPSQMASKSH